MQANSLVTLNGVGLQYAGTEKKVLNNFNYRIAVSDRVILLGSNGSGKSSLIKLLNRTYIPTQGHIAFDEQPLNRLSTRELSQQIVTITQDLRDSLFFNLTVLENCLLWETRNTFSLFDTAIKQKKAFYQDYLATFHPKLSSKLDTYVTALSGGEKQSLILALCLLHPPKLLLLDEHTSAMDPKIAIDLMEYTDQKLKEKNITCVIATHDLDIAIRYGNRLLALAHNEVRLQAEQEEKQKLSVQELLETCYH